MASAALHVVPEVASGSTSLVNTSSPTRSTIINSLIPMHNHQNVQLWDPIALLLSHLAFGDQVCPVLQLPGRCEDGFQPPSLQFHRIVDPQNPAIGSTSMNMNNNPLNPDNVPPIAPGAVQKHIAAVEWSSMGSLKIRFRKFPAPIFLVEKQAIMRSIAAVVEHFFGKHCSHQAPPRKSSPRVEAQFAEDGDNHMSGALVAQYKLAHNSSTSDMINSDSEDAGDNLVVSAHDDHNAEEAFLCHFFFGESENGEKYLDLEFPMREKQNGNNTETAAKVALLGQLAVLHELVAADTALSGMVVKGIVDTLYPPAPTDQIMPQSGTGSSPWGTTGSDAGSAGVENGGGDRRWNVDVTRLVRNGVVRMTKRTGFGQEQKALYSNLGGNLLKEKTASVQEEASAIGSSTSSSSTVGRVKQKGHLSPGVSTCADDADQMMETDASFGCGSGPIEVEKDPFLLPCRAGVVADDNDSDSTNPEQPSANRKAKSQFAAHRSGTQQFTYRLRVCRKCTAKCLDEGARIMREYGLDACSSKADQSSPETRTRSAPSTTPAAGAQHVVDVPPPPRKLCADRARMLVLMKMVENGFEESGSLTKTAFLGPDFPHFSRYVPKMTWEVKVRLRRARDAEHFAEELASVSYGMPGLKGKVVLEDAVGGLQLTMEMMRALREAREKLNGYQINYNFGVGHARMRDANANGGRALKKAASASSGATSDDYQQDGSTAHEDALQGYLLRVNKALGGALSDAGTKVELDTTFSVLDAALETVGCIEIDREELQPSAAGAGGMGMRFLQWQNMIKNRSATSKNKNAVAFRRPRVLLINGERADSTCRDIELDMHEEAMRQLLCEGEEENRQGNKDVQVSSVYTFDSFKEHVKKFRPHVWYYFGHTNGPNKCFASRGLKMGNGDEPVNAQDLNAFLKELVDTFGGHEACLPRFVVLLGCHTLTVGKVLETYGIPTVCAPEEPLREDAMAFGLNLMDAFVEKILCPGVAGGETGLLAGDGAMRMKLKKVGGGAGVAVSCPVATGGSCPGCGAAGCGAGGSSGGNGLKNQQQAIKGLMQPKHLQLAYTSDKIPAEKDPLRLRIEALCEKVIAESVAATSTTPAARLRNKQHKKNFYGSAHTKPNAKMKRNPRKNSDGDEEDDQDVDKMESEEKPLLSRRGDHTGVLDAADDDDDDDDLEMGASTPSTADTSCDGTLSSKQLHQNRAPDFVALTEPAGCQFTMRMAVDLKAKLDELEQDQTENRGDKNTKSFWGKLPVGAWIVLGCVIVAVIAGIAVGVAYGVMAANADNGNRLQGKVLPEQIPDARLLRLRAILKQATPPDLYAASKFEGDDEVENQNDENDVHSGEFNKNRAFLAANPNPSQLQKHGNGHPFDDIGFQHRHFGSREAGELLQKPETKENVEKLRIALSGGGAAGEHGVHVYEIFTPWLIPKTAAAADIEKKKQFIESVSVRVLPQDKVIFHAVLPVTDNLCHELRNQTKENVKTSSQGAPWGHGDVFTRNEAKRRYVGTDENVLQVFDRKWKKSFFGFSSSQWDLSMQLLTSFPKKITDKRVWQTLKQVKFEDKNGADIAGTEIEDVEKIGTEYNRELAGRVGGGLRKYLMSGLGDGGQHIGEDDENVVWLMHYLFFRTDQDTGREPV